MARAPAPSPRRTLVKVLVPVVVVVVAGFAFWRSVHSARSAPYTLTAATQRPWRLVVELGPRPNEPALVLQPPTEVSHELFDQVFKRSMESMHAPESQGIPLVLAGELGPAGAARVTSDQLVAMARAAGLEAVPPTPRCMGHRRAPEPDTRQQTYFAMFDVPALTTFRSNLATRLGPGFDAGLVTPAMFVGVIESSVERWLPLRADAEKDCVAPITVTAGP